jgi:hypothetical protein
MNQSLTLHDIILSCMSTCILTFIVSAFILKDLRRVARYHAIYIALVLLGVPLWFFVNSLWGWQDSYTREEVLWRCGVWMLVSAVLYTFLFPFKGETDGAEGTNGER